MASKDKRRAELAKIHIAKKELGMSEDDYRAMLLQVGGKESAGDLSAAARRQVLDHLAALGGKSARRKTYPGRPKNIDGGRHSRAEQLKKIEALLTVGKKPWSYGDALALRICKVAKVAWVPDHDLYKIITALRKEGQRKGWDLND